MSMFGSYYCNKEKTDLLLKNLVFDIKSQILFLFK